MPSIPIDLFNFKRLNACATSERCIGSVEHREASACESFAGLFSQIFSTHLQGLTVIRN